MKKQYHLIALVLLTVLVLVGCAPSWQPPIMGPEPASNVQLAPVDSPLAAQVWIAAEDVLVEGGVHPVPVLGQG